MMTCIKIGRIGNVGCAGERFPRWAAEWAFRTDCGAVTGRGGRRKRRARRREILHMKPPIVRRAGWPMHWLKGNAALAADADRRGLRFPLLGYRERRRRAKLRRRRARAAERPEWRQLAEATRQTLRLGFHQESEWVKNRMARTT